MTGKKFDGGKPRISLVPLKQFWLVIDVLEFGARKYAEDNWKRVAGARVRYFDAAMRHISSWWNGEKADPETGLPHLAHAICCLLFLMWLDDNPTSEAEGPANAE
ncbi:dATP/dGTP diphosphohydrolase domain-containing protein [Pantoea septica]|uniref:dATP/dGTP diphosphohydrolase domain-containing protein n=1 Tax=Pantoea septica TaxID=472695 RepID=UPI0023F7DBE6|nr:dATP/dGTP diphosphohydrolase domain-containing protein [Pantoea septica]